MKRMFNLAVCILCVLQQAGAQFNQPWRGKKCAVVITYDDAVDQHLDHAIPLLDSLGLKATFYITGFSQSMQTRLNDWKKIATNGHELGNHTLYHPCLGGTPGREWVRPEYDLNNYSVQRMLDEVRATNVLLQSMDGKTKRTFAFTCADTRIHDTLFPPLLKNDFTAMRNVRHAVHRIDQIDLDDVDCYMVNGERGEQLISWVKQAADNNGLLVILFHGVGGGNPLNVSLEAHRQLLQYLKQNEKDIWIAPMVEIADHIKEWQARDQSIKRIQKATQEDYKHMLGQLRIDSIRRGPSGNPTAPSAANTDESKATPYTSLPDPLRLKNGKLVTDAKTWWNKRRPQIVEDFDKEIYGRLPKNIPAVKWEVVSITNDTAHKVPAITKKLLGRVDNSSYPSITVNIDLTLTTPANSNGPVPVIMEFGFVFPPGFRPSNPSTDKTWQQQLLEKGWGYAILVPASYQADNGAGLTEGIIGLVNKGQRRKPDDWGALRAWAWGASRAIDYLETDKDVNAKAIGIEGLSRYGKAAIVAMAYEPRLAVAFVGSSGAGGAKILRRVLGEQVENLASSGEYHWFAGNFIKYAGPLTPMDMPVDAHHLVALCAPRPVFISSGSPSVEGQWVDAKGMFLGGVHAGPVYRLLGKKDLGTMEFPRIETALIDGDIAFRQHSGGHTTGPNWPTFIQWAEKYLR